MAGEWLAITGSDLNVDNRFVGIEPEGPLLKALEPHVNAAKHNLRRKARTAFDGLYTEYWISDTDLFDAVAALPATGATADLYEDLRHLLRLETLAAFYSNLKGKRGQQVNLTDRAKDYADDAAGGLPDVADKIWSAIDSGDLILVGGTAQRRSNVVWVM